MDVINFPVWLFVTYLTFQSIAAMADDISVKISTCDVPLKSRPLSLCCHTENIPKLTTIFFYHEREMVARVSQSCDLIYPMNDTETFTWSCDKHLNSNSTVYKLAFNATVLSSQYGSWKCGYYGSSSKISLTADTFLTSHDGYNLLQPGDTPNLSWQLRPMAKLNLRIINPTLEVIMSIESSTIVNKSSDIEFVGNISNGAIGVRWNNVEPSENGTYICVYKDGQRTVREGITLVVLEPPGNPTVAIVKDKPVTMVNNIATGSLICNATSNTAAPLFYRPNVTFVWLVPDFDLPYNYTENGNTIDVFNLNCVKPYFRPIFCQVSESGMTSVNSKPFSPLTICESLGGYTTRAPTPPPMAPEQYRAFVGAVTFLAVALVCVTSVSCVVGRKYVRRKSRRALRKLCCCRWRFGTCRTCYRCCRRCLDDPDDMSSSDSDSDDIPEIPPLGLGLEDGLSGGDNTIRRVLEQSRLEAEQAGARDLAGDVQGQPADVSGVVLEGAVGGETPPGTSASAETQILNEVETLLVQHHRHLKEPAVRLDVHRSNVFHNLMSYYTTEPEVAVSSVNINLLDEEGWDYGGVTLDIYTTFWDKVVDAGYFVGHESLLPFLPKHKMSEEQNFKILGRILSHTVALLRAFPVRICKSAIICMVHQTTEVDRDAVLEDFLNYLDSDDKDLLMSAIKDFSSLTEDEITKVQETIFIRFSFGTRIHADNFMEQLYNLARHVICIEPKPLLELMRSGIPETHLEHFWSMFFIQNLDILYRTLKPSPDRVIARLQTDSSERDISSGAKSALRYLKRLIKEMDEPELETFLHFVTGKKSIPRGVIKVAFTTEIGAGRIPKAHTCSSMLELPETYRNYEEFRSEVKHVLASEESMLMFMP